MCIETGTRVPVWKLLCYLQIFLQNTTLRCVCLCYNTITLFITLMKDM